MGMGEDDGVEKAVMYEMQRTGHALMKSPKYENGGGSTSLDSRHVGGWNLV